ncbi:adenylosuccinate synthase [Nocardiopsis sp. Huas11]|uniref:adenylosuccinate synthetase n=1 Tax=Nocardiopsis sp. Huas11 TaxID=2183912 RepID=UPI000EB49E49|nr:adenylosuccinate synthetase [Nocardiopsis sp. Huas11]RKS09910.1 adenylosuccinate synthase [Nocardiopsis sp. Huas11]
MSRTSGPRADEHAIVVDLGFGDAGKGVTVDLLCARRRYGAVVRANGGAQAAHNVVTPDGRHHTFSQFGSGTLAPGGPVPTHLSRLAVVDPFALAAEARHLAELGIADPFALVTVDRRALISTPWHQAANRARERARGSDRHGSCGMGVGETMAYALAHPGDAPTAGDCAHPARLRRKLRLLADHLRDRLGDHPSGEAGPDGTAGSPDLEECVSAYAAFAQRVRLVDEAHLPHLLASAPVVFEGAQGVLLDEWHGFHPYTTWSTTTTANPLALLAEAGRPGQARRIGVVRTYTTRHGAGPLVTEDPALGSLLPEPHNGTHPWQGPFRIGHLDLVAHRYALAATGGVDSLVVTHTDAFAGAGPADGSGTADAVEATDGRPLWCTAYANPDGTALHLVPEASPDLERQERLTRALLRVRPVLAAIPDDDLGGAIGRALGLPLEAEFGGPTRADARVSGSRGRGPGRGPRRGRVTRRAPTRPN